MSSSEADGMGARFPSPFDVATPPGAEGWRDLYPYYLQFSQENRAWEEDRLWFQDGMHHGGVLYPFDSIVCDAWRVALGEYNTRIFAVPPAYGVEHRVLNGYLYCSVVLVTDPAEIQSRAEVFQRRAGHYFANWGRLFEAWKAKMEGVIDDLRRIEPPTLPDLDPEDLVTSEAGIGLSFRVLDAWDRLTGNLFLAWQHHFEMLILGYAAYLNLFEFCRGAFPNISQEAMAQMTGGADLLFFRSDDQLKQLARLALDLGVADRLRAELPPEEIVESLRREPAGSEWVAALERAMDPWFHFSNGTGLAHGSRSWVDDLRIPWRAMLSYVGRLERDESIDRPTAEILERRDRVAAGYRRLLTTEEDRATFDQNLGLARTVSSYVEDHNFYVEHWHHTIFWQKARTFGSLLRDAGFLEDPDELFLLNRWEVGQALYEAVTCWATGAPARGGAYWGPQIRERQRILAALSSAAPAPALGIPPPEMNEPFSVLLWGLTSERMRDWLGAETADQSPGGHRTLRGVAASPGTVEGPARVVLSTADLAAIRDGEILVTTVTSPSWGPIFQTIGGTVSDIGGIMSHAAIVSREYGLPAVVGTGSGTATIRTGDLIRVDGDVGSVTILTGSDEAG